MRSMASSGSCKGIATIVGVGPRLGRSIARKFAHEGYTVAILARDLGRLSVFADEIAREEKAQVFAIRIDCSESRSVREAFEVVLSLGFVEVLVYNAYHSPISASSSSSNVPLFKNFTDITLDSFQKSLTVSSLGAFLCAQQVLPGMVERRRGTILFTGCSASLNGIPGYSDFCCGKFALRGLSQCLAREFRPLGVHVAHVIIHGFVAPPRGGLITGGNAYEWGREAILASTAFHHRTSSSTSSVGDQSGGIGVGVGDEWMDPDALAQTYWHLHIQDPAAWTQEIDLHPSNPITSARRFF